MIFHWIVDLVLIVLLILFTFDGLTFLWVRRVYQIVYHFFSKTYPHQVILLDVDDFKKLNDKFGHRFGDLVLRKIGIILLKESKLRAFRYGGEEFAILLPWTKTDEAMILAEIIREKIYELKFEELGRNGHVSVSIGIGRFEEDADKALYVAKAFGKNCIEISVKPG